jgi:RNA-directed DNA polymerase
MEGEMEDTQRSQTITTELHQIAKQAREYPERVFTSLAHLMDVDFLREAYRKTRKDVAPGIDGIRAKEYARNLEDNLGYLHSRLRENRYKAPPVKRAWIGKDDGSRRPLCMPVFEDKVVQRAVSMLMSAVYEQDFYDFSFGFREGHSPHQAIKEVRKQCNNLNIHWIVDADVSGFFDNLDHGILREIIKKRVNDGGLIRLIGKWLKTGVLDGKALSYPKKGTPQGGVISPLLANIFLHQVLDEWYVKMVKPLLKGHSFLIRYADDFIIGCEIEEDARRIMSVLPKRFNRFNLTVHPKKTKLVDFRTPSRRNDSGNETHTFDFLGFTHYWGKSRKGSWVIKRKTAAKRLRRAMKFIWMWCRDHRHYNMPEQYVILCSKLRGHYQYYGITGNYKMLEVIFEYTEKAWRRWLGRRTRDGYISGEIFERKMRRIFPLPRPRIVHSI